MDKPHSSNVYNDHTHSNNFISTPVASSSSTHSSNTSRSYRANRRREDTPSKTRKDTTTTATTPDGKYMYHHHDHLDKDTRRTKYTTNSTGGSGGNKMLSSSGSGKQKATTPNKSPLSTPTGGDGGPSPNGNTSSARYHHRDVPPRFQLYGSSNNKHNKHTPNSKNPHSRQGNSKKSRDGGSGSSSGHWSGNNVPDNTWSTTSSSSTAAVEPDMEHHHHHHQASSTSGQQQQSKDRSRLYNTANTHNPWSSNVMADHNHGRHHDASNWTPQGEDGYPDTIRGGEDQDMIMASCELGDKKDLCSDFDELEITESVPPSHGSGEGHHRFRNSDSDAMKDGVSSSSSQIKDLVGGGEDPLEGGGLPNEGGLWRGHISRSSMGSSSSVNSAGSNSSWKGGSNGGRSSSSGGGGGNSNSYQRSASPRKHSGKYETNRSLSTSSGKVSAMKVCNKTKKNVMELDEAMDSLQGEPSGWGDLPSPKPSEVDTGTEVWGIPDDIKQKMKKDTPSRNGWTETNRVDDWALGSGGGVTTSTGWGDQGFVGKGPGGGGNGSGQWATTPGGGDLSWTTTGSAATTPTHSIKPNNGSKGIGFSDNVKLLVDMGFSVADSEGTLKRNNNNFEAALGDLLALVSIKDDENPPDLSPSNFPLPGPISRGSSVIGKNPNSTNRLSPSLSHSGGPSPRTTSPSSLTQYTKDQSFQLKPHISGSTPVTPTVPASSTQNHLMQPTSSIMPPKLPRSISAPQGTGDLSNVNTQYVQKVLTQQLKDHQLVKQQLINQLKNPQSPKHQQMLTQRLNQTNTNIMIVNQHLVLTNQLALQQQQKQKPSIDTGKGHHESGTPSSATLSPPEVFGGIEMVSSSSSDVQQRSSLNSSSSAVSTTSTNGSNTTHSMSRLQRIISSGGSQETFPVVENQSVFDNEDQYNVPTPIGPSFVNNGETSDELSSKQPGTTAANSSTNQSSLTSSGKFTRSVDEIPEFKPGVPWNPNSNSATNNNHSMSFHSRKPVTQRPDNTTTQRPDSIPLTMHNTTYNHNPENYMDSTPDNPDYYGDTIGHGTTGSGYPPTNTHLTTSQQYRRTSGSSPSNVGGIGQPNPRGFNSGNHPIGSNGTTGFNNSSTGYYTRQQSSGQSFMPPRPSPGTPNSSQMFPPNQFNPTGMNNRNRQRLYSQQSVGGGGYNGEMGTGSNSGSQRNRGGYDSGRKWSFDGGNPWGVPEKSGTSIWSMDSSNDSMLSPTVDSEAAVFSPAIEWRAPIRKPSLPVHLSAPTTCILLKNLSPQVDEISIREVCSEFGYVQSCSFNSFNGSALVVYQSKEEALQAKIGLEKNPVICGVSVQPSLATEKTIATFHEQRTPSHTYNHPTGGRIDPGPPSPWLSSESLISPSSRPQSRIGSVGGGGNTRSPFVSTIPPSLGRHAEIGKKEPKSAWNQEQLAPGGPISSSSVWSSNGGVLPGISSSWGPTANQSNPSNEAGVVPDETLAGTSPSMTTYLPNGLF